MNWKTDVKELPRIAHNEQRRCERCKGDWESWKEEWKGLPCNWDSQEKKDSQGEVIAEEIIAENFSELVRDMNSHLHVL